MHVETCKHLFWECMNIQKFWKQITYFLSSKQIPFECNYKTISLGVSQSSPYKNLLNFVIICAKYYIYSSKIKKNEIIFEHFKQIFYQQIEIEKEIALNRDKFREFEQKWQKLL